MDVVTAGRSLIADTLAFHLFFVLFGVGLPVLIAGLEGYSIFKKRPYGRQVARSWSRALVILFIAGAVSGTIVSLQFNLIWPTFTSFAGKVVGVSFALEGFAFLIEALFLSIYMLSWDRFKPIWHWLIGCLVALSALASAFFITTVNAWMNTPQGFNLDAHGNPIDINTRQAVFSPAAKTEISHSILAYLFAATLALLAVYAWMLWRRKMTSAAKTRAKKLMVGLAAVALILGLAVGFAGDQSGKFDARYEPYKLAAAEGLQQTQTGAPLLIGGIVQGNQVKHAVKIPKLLSFLATGHFNGTVEGLDSTQAQNRPPATVHYFFDAMVSIGIFTVLVTLVYLLGRWHRADWVHSRWFLALLVLCGILGIFAAEFGWMVTEFGRQPFVIRGVMRVSAAVTHSKAVIGFGEIFPVLYLILFSLTIIGLRRGVKLQEALDEHH